MNPDAGVEVWREELSVASGLLLVQLGTPDAPTASAVRRYLREFLSDRRVVDYPPWLWYPILYGPILAFRPKKSAQLYAKIWTPQGSPLLVNSLRLRDALREEMGEQWRIELGMRYGNPNWESALEALQVEELEHLLVLPLFPQYSRTTSESVFDVVTPWLEQRKKPFAALRSWAGDPSYIHALACSVRTAVDAHGPPSRWLLSFHGIPKRYVRQGDPYDKDCETTARLLAAEMGWEDHEWEMAYQSRFGPEAWLGPETAKRLEELGRAGEEKLYVLAPAFTADCLETIDELGEMGADSFHEAGGGEFRLVPCLNDQVEFVEALAQLARRESKRASTQ